MTTRTLGANHSKMSSGYIFWRDARGTSHQAEIGEFITIGRDISNHIVLDDEFVSGRHARIERRGDVFVLKDMRSRNGTCLNNARVLEAVLADGDRFSIGRTEIKFTSCQDKFDVTALTSKNPRWNEQLAQFPGIARSDFPVLLLGPSGSGKDVLAQNLHLLSDRAGGPFVSVNCSALSESLVESELFGHVKGSFTGASGDRKGAFEAARGGTLFLDEIGDLPLNLQPKLLRALENNQIRPVGSDRSVTTDVRVIAATHRDLKRMALENKFRSDLYFRLHVIHVQVPALVERMEDFDDLLYHFAREMKVRFSFAAIQRLKSHTWPGNIRELKNVVARAKAYSGGDEVQADLIPRLIDTLVSGERQKTEGTLSASRSLLKEMEIDMIRNRLIANRGNQRRTAAELGIPKSTLHDRIKEYKINIDELFSKV